MLRVHGEGTWANYRFVGQLVGIEQPLVVASQNVSVAGMGGIRGFDVREGTDHRQISAVSFQEQGPLDADNHSTIVAKMWHLARRSPSEDDVLQAAMALLYVYPWPTMCDRDSLAARMKL